MPMKAIPLALLSVLLLTTGHPGHAAVPDAHRQRQVDALFARWQQPQSPGAAVLVVKEGRVVYRAAFGMADIEQARPLTPSTPVHVASLSKQFTALAVRLLAQDGRLSLDEDVRRYLPELPDFGTPLRIRQLLNHTSGLRDQWNLLALAGWRMEDVITDEDVMRLVRQQRALNFPPGSEFEYSNTGYTLLAALVERVSGQSLAAFAKARIFLPLGMRNTFFHERYAELVPGRAQSYQPSPGKGYEGVALSYSTVGPSSLFSTADDLALWSRNFDEGKVGGRPLLAEMQTPAKLADGTAISYAEGLATGSYRGLRTVAHSGADAGFRSYLLRFPDQGLAIVIVGNGADLQATRLGQRLADLYLDGQLAAPPAPVPDHTGGTEVPIAPAALDALVGSYALQNGAAITFSKAQGHLVGWTAGDDPVPFYPAGEREFFARLINARFTFDAPRADGLTPGGTYQRNARARPATRMTPAPLSDSEAQALSGRYFSEELQVLYTVTAKGGQLTLQHPRGELALVPYGQDGFLAPWPFGLLQFQCAPAAGCSGFTVNEDRARQVAFSKVRLVAAGAVLP